MTAPLAHWLQGRSERERRLLGLATGASVLAVALQLGTLVVRDLTAARSRVETAEHDLATVRRLARELGTRRPASDAAHDTPLVTRLEATASTVIGRERIASMTPTLGGSEGVALRLVGTSLAEAVQVLHGIEAAGDRVDRFDMVKHPDDPGRFDLTLEITADGAS
jgi:hypothetical protein